MLIDRAIVKLCTDIHEHKKISENTALFFKKAIKKECTGIDAKNILNHLETRTYSENLFIEFYKKISELQLSKKDLKQSVFSCIDLLEVFEKSEFENNYTLRKFLFPRLFMFRKKFENRYPFNSEIFKNINIDSSTEEIKNLVNYLWDYS